MPSASLTLLAGMKIELDFFVGDLASARVSSLTADGYSFWLMMISSKW